ncbi:MAG: SGNH/GDSL hydrolase family protein [Bacteroidales bacterium]|nr:SGNH/GDSL hydrolase family protein [Bacteroidales bacterium]
MKKNTLNNIVLLVTSVIFSLLILELSFRFYLFGKDSFSIQKMNSVHQIGVAGILKTSEYPGVIFELKPNLNTYFKLSKFATNDEGLRDKHYDCLKPDDAFRIVVIGDSFTMPTGVDLEHSYHAVLEERLNEEQDEMDYQIINFGVGGYCLSQYVSVLKFKALDYLPDLILIGFCPENDHEILPEERGGKPFREKPIEYSFYTSFVINTLVRTINNYAYENYVNTKDFIALLNNDQLQNMDNQFSDFRAISEDLGIPVIIVYLHYIDNTGYSKLIESLAQKNNFYFENISKGFEGADVRKFRIYRTDRHPNEKAHKLFSDQIYNFFKEKNLLNNKLVTIHYHDSILK